MPPEVAKGLTPGTAEGRCNTVLSRVAYGVTPSIKHASLSLSFGFVLELELWAYAADASLSLSFGFELELELWAQAAVELFA